MPSFEDIIRSGIKKAAARLSKSFAKKCIGPDNLQITMAVRERYWIWLVFSNARKNIVYRSPTDSRQHNV